MYHRYTNTHKKIVINIYKYNSDNYYNDNDHNHNLTNEFALVKHNQQCYNLLMVIYGNLFWYQN